MVCNEVVRACRCQHHSICSLCSLPANVVIIQFSVFSSGIEQLKEALLDVLFMCLQDPCQALWLKHIANVRWREASPTSS